jgi:hypothetical protein
MLLAIGRARELASYFTLLLCVKFWRCLKLNVQF